MGSRLPAWLRYLADFRKAYPGVLFLGYSPYYFTPMQAALVALEAVDGDLSDGGRRLQATLASLRLESPTGPVRLNRHRQAIATNYLTKVVRGSSGLTQRTIRTFANVDDSYAGRFSPTKPLPSRTYPPCTHGNAPPWAH